MVQKKTRGAAQCNKKTLMIAFGSGGAPALASIGVLSVLIKHKIYPAAVAGTSMGAVVAAYYGVHGEIETLREWYETRRSHQYFSYVGGPSRRALLETQKLGVLLDGFFEHKTFSQTLFPVRIIATDLRTGEEKKFSSGPLIDAVMASTAIPGIMPARRIGDDLYVDGAAVNPTPVDAYPMKAYDHVLAVDFHFHVPEKLGELGLIDTFRRSVFIAPHYAFTQRLRKRKSRCTVLSLGQVERDVLGFNNSAKYIKRGEVAAEALIREWKRNGLYDTLRV